MIFQNLIIDNQISGINRVLQHAEHPASQQGSRFCLRLAGDCIPQGFHWQDSQPHTEPERMAYVQSGKYFSRGKKNGYKPCRVFNRPENLLENDIWTVITLVPKVYWLAKKLWVFIWNLTDCLQTSSVQNFDCLFS